MRTLTVIFYFSLAIILFAATGVVIPYVFEAIKHTPHSVQDLNQNIVTYFIAIFASASLDLVLKLIDKETAYKKVAILGLLLLCILVIGATAFLLYYNANGYKDELLKYLILGVLLSYVMWWVAHYRDEVFNPPVNSLGGNTDRPLRNG